VTAVNDARTFELRAFTAGTFNGNINGGAVSFAAGAAGSNAITISGLKEGTAYDLVLRALCQGGNPGTSPVAQVSGTTEGGTNPVPTEDKITIDGVGNKPASNSMSFTVNYSATQKRTLYAEVRGPRVNGALGKWYGAKTVDVDAGSGNQNITVGLSSVPPAGSGYQVRVHIRPVNTSWQQAINADSANFIVGNGAGNPPAPVITPETVTLNTVHDAYLQGANRHNTNIIRVEKNKRTAYLMFDLSGITGTITKAQLKFTVASDPGSGNVNVHRGATNNWTENNLSNGNKPATATLLGNLAASYKVGASKTIDLNVASISGDRLSLLLTMTSGNDFAFASKEGGTNTAPELILTYNKVSTALRAASKNEGVAIKMFPNPMNDVIHVAGVTNGTKVEVYNSVGLLQLDRVVKNGQISIDMRALPSGYYIVKVIDSKNLESITKTVLKQ